MPKLLISTTVGTSDPTRASIPFHVATNGAAKGGVECGMVIAGDAADLMKREVAASVRGVGVPPLTDLIAGCETAGIRFYI
ncbi:MAG: hypothetical protein AAB295_02490 [Chloroflexota bacterium]